MADTENPKKKTEPKRDKQLNVRLTLAQFEAIERNARRIGLDASTFARMVILKGTDYDPENE